MPKRYLRNPLLFFKNIYFIGALALAAITYLLTFVASPEQLLNWYSTIMAVVATWGMWKWGGGSMTAILNGDISKPSLGVVAVFLLMAHLALSRGNTVGVISFGWPSYEQSYTAAVLVLIALVGVIAFALASRTDDPFTPKSPRTASFIAGFLSFALLLFSGAIKAIEPIVMAIGKFLGRVFS